MKLKEALAGIKKIRILKDTFEAVKTVAREIQSSYPDTEMIIEEMEKLSNEKGCLNIGIASPEVIESLELDHLDMQMRFVFFKPDSNGGGSILSSKPEFLYSYMMNILENADNIEIDEYSKGRLTVPSFNWQRSLYDYFLTQEGRIQKGFDRESYIRELARLGFTHIEINGLAFPMAIETGPKGETYPMFYTYCPALDQFVHSKLNEGLYPYYYLSANFDYLKQNALLAKKYGLVPGLLSFEPRSVPEEFFVKYPMLRGARVDHPFRSFRPRFIMTTTHQKVLEHYSEMITKIMNEIPELGYMSVWTNDSGAGFEHTKSLYVGRNGGPYMIREWKDDSEIAKIAGENAVHFLRNLRDAGRKINPDFRVITRMESFYGEHDTVWAGLGDKLEVESASLITKGWNVPYSHPKYKDITDINAGTIYQQDFDESEKKYIDELEKRDGASHFYFSAGPHAMFEPLIGIPFAKLTHKRLKTLYSNGVDHVSHLGGTCPVEMAPYNINHEVTRLFQFDPEMDIDKSLENIAEKWAGEFKLSLIEAWKQCEEAIMAFPNITPLYSTHGFTWYRLWARPLVPNIEAISKEDRAYYEEQMCTTLHNPNNVDLARDVLFQLTDPEKCRKVIERMDENIWKPLDNALKVLSDVHAEANSKLGKNNVIHDNLIRISALASWFMTQRNVAEWIYCVHGYINTDNTDEKDNYRAILSSMIKKEIQNTRALSKLLSSDIEFMAISGKGETPLMYGTNFGSLLQKRIGLMTKHIDDEPYIDPDYMMKNAGKPVF